MYRQYIIPFELRRPTLTEKKMHYMYIPYVDDRAAFTLSHSSAFCTDQKM